MARLSFKYRNYCSMGMHAQNKKYCGVTAIAGNPGPRTIMFTSLIDLAPWRINRTEYFNQFKGATG